MKMGADIITEKPMSADELKCQKYFRRRPKNWHKSNC
ncbi:MAG: hypothetical protein ACI8UX_001904, partial [Psychromonas sp.]